MALIKRGRRPLVRELENALVKRAFGYEYEEVKTSIRTEGKGEHASTTTFVEKTKKHLPADVGALAICLKNMSDYSDNPAMLELKRLQFEFEREQAKDKGWS